MTWQEQLKEDVKKVLAHSPKKRSDMNFTPMTNVEAMAAPRKIRLKEQPKDNAFALPLFLLVLLLGVGLVFAWYIKQVQSASPSKAYQQPHNSYVLPHTPPYTPPSGNPSTPPWRPQPESGQPDTRLIQDIHNLKKVVQLMWDKQKLTIEKMTLLAIVVNQNFTVIERNLPRSEMIYLNADWTIDQMPSQLNLDEADKEFLRKYLKQR